MRVEKTTTGIIIKEPTMDVKRAVLRYFSLTNPTREFFIYCGNDPDNEGLFGGEKDVIYLTSGALNIRDMTMRHLSFGMKTITPPIPQKIELGSTREPRSELQKDCINKLLTSNSKKITIEVRPGVGKCEPYSRKIPCFNSDTGYKLMGELNVGDSVFDRSGRPTRILQIFEQGEKDVYKLTFSDGRTAYCGLEHLWTVRRQSKSHISNFYGWETMTLKDLMCNFDQYITYIPVCKPVNYPHKDVELTDDVIDQFIDHDSISQDYLINDVTTRCWLLDKFFTKENLSENIQNQLQWIQNSLNTQDLKELKIESIEFSHKEQCRCLMVDNTEHLYLTEDFIVTHNTFIAMYSISKLGLKPLIVCPTTNLKAQWIENIVNEGIDTHDIATNIFEAQNKKICVVTITSLENAIREDWNRLKAAVTDGSFGIKIVDESHLHLKGIMKFDAICNIEHNWYLSATLGRSDDSEDKILNRLFLDADRFIGSDKYVEYQKEYIQIYLQDIYYNPTQKLCDETFSYGTKGLVKATYYRMLMEYKGGEPFYNNIITMMKRARSVVSDGKMLVLVPLLEIIDTIKERIEQDPDLNKLSLGWINGKMSPDQKSDMLNRDIILSTTMSVGTGVDIMNLRSVINFDQYQSPIINEQIVGRLRDRGEICHYFDICDHVKYARTISNWGMKRRNYFIAFPGIKKEMKRLQPIYT